VQLSWAVQLRQAILTAAEGYLGSVKILELECVGGEEVALLFSADWFEGTRGVRMSSADCKRLQYFSVEANKEWYFDELGYYVVECILVDPAYDEDFTVPDGDGIRWRILDYEDDSDVKRLGKRLSLSHLFQIAKQRLFRGKYYTYIEVYEEEGI
jgi:hypothetical protein